ncbi:MAG: hypothetical protein M0R74_17065 [Dehalococcoidia bacterium]|jgi:hypothetical protein|nr:hypothetical protein [Dehalococcoidia bacterium]
MDDFIVGRKDIIEFLRKPLDLSPTTKTAWNKILRWRRNHGMEELFHRDITGRPYIIGCEVKEWIARTDRQRVPKQYPKGESKEIMPANEGIGQ